MNLAEVCGRCGLPFATVAMAVDRLEREQRLARLAPIGGRPARYRLMRDE